MLKNLAQSIREVLGFRYKIAWDQSPYYPAVEIYKKKQEAETRYIILRFTHDVFNVQIYKHLLIGRYEILLMIFGVVWVVGLGLWSASIG